MGIKSQVTISCDGREHELKASYGDRVISEISKTKAAEEAKRDGWTLNPKTGAAFCPDCSREKKK